MQVLCYIYFLSLCNEILVASPTVAINAQPLKLVLSIVSNITKLCLRLSHTLPIVTKWQSEFIPTFHSQWAQPYRYAFTSQAEKVYKILTI